MAKHNSKDEQHINVSVRIRPYSDAENESKCATMLEVLSKKEIITRSNYNQKRYILDRVFDCHSSQLEIYNAVVAPLIPEVIGGYNCTVFAYGQTGTGKTFTMEGFHNCDNQVNAGIIPRALTHIFKALSNMNSESSVKVSYLELYNEELFDLLSQSHLNKAIKIFEDKAQKGSVILQGLEELSVTEIGQVYKILEQGAEKRRIASTYINNASSRSHAVFTIVVHTREITVDGEELVKTGKLNLVDLAGSENISKSGAVDKRAREAGSINQSLLTLGRVIKALTERNTHIPYRESKLTRILQDSLGGRTKTSLIATVSAANVNMEETLNTLEYAMRARCIQNRPELNQKISRTALINQYSDTIEKLQRDLIATRTGTGVYVDEDNYEKLVTDNQIQKVELTEKKTLIKKLETDIADYSEKLHILQDTWTEAANNIERLSNEKKILQQDLILVKEVNQQKDRELQGYKQKVQYLKDETRHLLSDISTHAQNEDTLHKKVSYLYQTSHSNKDVTNAFYNMHNKIFLELMSNIDKCIWSSLTVVTEQFVTDNTLEQNCSFIKSNIEKLLKMSADLENYQIKYFENKKPLEARFESYYNTIQTFTNNFQEKSNVFCKKLQEYLKDLYNVIADILDEHPSNIQSILPSLFKLKETLQNEFACLSNIQQEFHSGLLETIDDLKKHSEIANNMNKDTFVEMTNIQQEMEDLINRARNVHVSLVNCKNRQDTTVNYVSQLNEKLDSFKESTNASIKTIDEEHKNKLEILEKATQVSVVVVNQFIDSAQGRIEEVKSPLKDKIDDALVFNRNIENNYDKYNKEFNKYYTEVKQSESIDDEHCTTLKQISENITQESEDTNGGISQLLEVNDKLVENARKVVSVLREGHTCSNVNSKTIKNLVDEFCGRELQYPTHAGDTPQKVQPKSSLYVNTLTKNCFNKEDNNKENSSSFLNLLKSEEDLKD